jgi:FtsH-binding integral membrane protein
MAVNINRRKLLIAGLAAGIVLNIIDFLSNGVILSARMQADANAFKAGLGDEMAAMGGAQIAVYVFFDFIVGFLLAWTYAAIRPRFGPGPRTALYVGLLFFVFGLILTFGYKELGVMSSGLWWMYTGIWFVNLLIASAVAGWVYSEDEVRVA